MTDIFKELFADWILYTPSYIFVPDIGKHPILFNGKLSSNCVLITPGIQISGQIYNSSLYELFTESMQQKMKKITNVVSKIIYAEQKELQVDLFENHPDCVVKRFGDKTSHDYTSIKFTPVHNVETKSSDGETLWRIMGEQTSKLILL